VPRTKRHADRSDTVYVWVDPVKGTYKFRGKYKRSCVDDIKSAIPKHGRGWRPEEKVWEVEPQFADELIAVLSDHYSEVVEHEEMYDKAEAAPAPASTTIDPYGELLRLCDNALLKKVYRMIAAELHPDRGGSQEKMQAANLAWESIRKERGM